MIQWGIIAFIALSFIRALYRMMVVRRNGIEAMARVSRTPRSATYTPESSSSA